MIPRLDAKRLRTILNAFYGPERPQDRTATQRAGDQMRGLMRRREGRAALMQNQPTLRRVLIVKLLWFLGVNPGFIVWFIAASQSDPFVPVAADGASANPRDARSV